MSLGERRMEPLETEELPKLTQNYDTFEFQPQSRMSLPNIQHTLKEGQVLIGG